MNKKNLLLLTYLMVSLLVAQTAFAGSPNIFKGDICQINVASGIESPEGFKVSVEAQQGPNIVRAERYFPISDVQALWGAINSLSNMRNKKDYQTAGFKLSEKIVNTTQTVNGVSYDVFDRYVMLQSHEYDTTKNGPFWWMHPMTPDYKHINYLDVNFDENGNIIGVVVWDGSASARFANCQVFVPAQ